MIGETHTYPDPRWAETMIRAHRGSRGPHRARLRKRQPQGPLSWAIFLLDYGRWLAGFPRGEIGVAPTHNAPTSARCC